MFLPSGNESVYRNFKNVIDDEEQKQTAMEIIWRQLGYLSLRLHFHLPFIW